MSSKTNEQAFEIITTRFQFRKVWMIEWLLAKQKSSACVNYL